MESLIKDLQNLREYLETEHPDLDIAKHRFELLRDRLQSIQLVEFEPEKRGFLLATVFVEQFKCEYLMLLHSGQAKEGYDSFLQSKITELRTSLGVPMETQDEQDHEFV